jgi:hypothetical protein
MTSNTLNCVIRQLLPARACAACTLRKKPGEQDDDPQPHLGSDSLLRVLELEIVGLTEAACARDEQSWEAGDQGVQVADDGVVVAPGVLNVVLDIDERLLQVEEVLTGLQVGIGLDERDDVADRRGQAALALAAAGDRLSLACARPRGDGAAERLGLVLRVPLDGRDQGWHQVPAPFQLNVDITPGTVGAPAQADELVVGPDEVAQDHHGHDGGDPHHGHGLTLPCHYRWPCGEPFSHARRAAS